jgi:hypothetical protein
MDNNSRHSLYDPEAENSKPTVVGIGASAGGLAALKQFFEHVPEDSGLAFVIVVHLAPEHKSLLPDLLQPHVRIPVQQVIETTALEPNRVYVIPPNANLSAIDTHLRLSQLEEERRERAPIDHFFRTLAASHDGHSVGIILNGNWYGRDAWSSGDKGKGRDDHRPGPSRSRIRRHAAQCNRHRRGGYGTPGGRNTAGHPAVPVHPAPRTRSEHNWDCTTAAGGSATQGAWPSANAHRS